MYWHIHFNPTVMQYWEITSKTCKHLPLAEQEVYNPTTQIMTVKVGSLTCVEYTIDFIVLFLSSMYDVLITCRDDF